MPDLITLAWIVGGLFLLAASLKAIPQPRPDAACRHAAPATPPRPTRP